MRSVKEGWELRDLVGSRRLHPRTQIIQAACAAEIQVRALGAQVVRIQQDAFDLALDSEVPGLHVGRIVPGADGAADAKSHPVSKACELPGGNWMPDGNGFERRDQGVAPSF